MPEMWLILGLCILGAAIIVLISHLVIRWHSRDVVVPTDQPSPYDGQFDAETVATMLDWYILRHLQDQRRMPRRQVFLDEDRERNDLLNRYAVHQLAKQDIHLTPMASTLTESVRPDGATHYLPRYFPDENLDSALVMFKHELIANRLISTIAYLHRIRDSKAVPLVMYSALREGNTPFVPDAYVTFYNDLVAEADDFDREPRIREKMRVLAVRMVFPAREPEFDYWRKRGLEIFQIAAPVARDAVTGWFYLKPSDIPLAQTKPKEVPGLRPPSPPPGQASTT